MDQMTVLVCFISLFGVYFVQNVNAFTDRSGDKKVIDTSQKECLFYCYGDSNCKDNCYIIDHVYCVQRCDGNVDCPNGADEKNCLATNETYPKDNGIDDGKLAWLKTTVYTVIVCTVGIVLLISVVVIGICRMKMKRAAMRRSMRQAERRRRHSHNCEGHESRSRRSEHVEHEPFISAPSPTHFGNIIVNVNNGVQYVPNSDFSTSVQSPPSYLEVMAESGIVGRHSPPPEYSTIDRNPNRTSQSPSENLNMQIVTETTSTSNNESASASQQVTHNTQNNSTDPPVSIQYSASMEDRNVANLSQTSASSTDAVQGTQSLGRRREQRSNRDRNVREVASPRRPKQLKVQEGQIILDDNSSNSSSPETVNRNTQTNNAEVSNTCQNSAKPGQLQVLGGQIILSNQESEASFHDEHSDGAVAQIDVKDGHIVFKPSGS
ncbi:hypothetical protein ACF0H5_015218 [Mactra antiquata]